MAKKYSEENILRRLIKIQNIYDAIKNRKDTSKFANIDKVAYILWQNSDARNSDICLSIKFYKQFYPEFIHDNSIKLDDLYNIPKMYDIQRTRADLQNTEGLFPATEEVQKKRIKKAKEFSAHYKEQKRKTFRLLPDYYLYMDESGKTDKYFVLAGVLLNGKQNNEAQRLRFNELKKRLNAKHKLSIKELKFADIKRGNVAFYKEFVDEIFKDGVSMSFLSIIVENKGLKQKSDRNKSKDLLEILLKELTSIIVRGTCGSPYAGKKAKINIILDKDGCGYDTIEKEKLKLNLEKGLKQEFKYLIALDEFTDIDSKDDIFVQFADLYASSLNNVFSKVKADSETSKCKKEFAKHLLNHIGLVEPTQSFPKKEATVRFINKFMPASK